jgi:hypothetical protein
VENLSIDLAELEDDIVLGTFQITIDHQKNEDVHIPEKNPPLAGRERERERGESNEGDCNFPFQVSEEYIEVFDPLDKMKVVGKLQISYKAKFIKNYSEDDIGEELHLGRNEGRGGGEERGGEGREGEGKGGEERRGEGREGKRGKGEVRDGRRNKVEGEGRVARGDGSEAGTAEGKRRGRQKGRAVNV